MTLKDIAYKNVLGNRYKYIMYYLSSSFIVMIFFIFANFICSAEGGIQLIKFPAKLFLSCEFIIVIFSLIFTKYSISTFLKSMGKEFELLSVLGLRKRDIRKYIMYESTVIALFSIITGIFSGVIFSKLFYMMIEVILKSDTSISFHIYFKSVTVTVLCFILIFESVSFIESLKIKKDSAVEIMKNQSKAKPAAKFSVIIAVLSVIFIVLGYYTACSTFSNIKKLDKNMFIVVVLVTVGTYFLFSQFSVFFTSLIKKRKSVFYRGTNMITLSQIIYKLRDNARVMFISSILCAVTLFLLIGTFSVKSALMKSMNEYSPNDISTVEKGYGVHKIIAPSKIQSILKKSNLSISGKTEVKMIKAKNSYPKEKTKSVFFNENIFLPDIRPYINYEDFFIMSETSYNNLAKEYKEPAVNIKDGEVIVHSYNFKGDTYHNLFDKVKTLNLQTGKEIYMLKLRHETKYGVINVDTHFSNTAVVSDKEFNKIYSEVSEEDKYTYYGYNIGSWKGAADSVKEIKKSESGDYFFERVDYCTYTMGTMSVIFFTCMFIAFLFFIAAESLIYFKIFNEIQSDKKDYIALNKIGMTKKEIKKSISVQSAIIFFLPSIIALINTFFMIKSIDFVFKSSGNHLFGFTLKDIGIYRGMVFVCIVYFCVQIIYYMFSKSMYMKEISR